MEMEFYYVVFVPYIEDGTPQWSFANESLDVVRDSIRRYHGATQFVGIYEFRCESAGTHTLR